MSEDDQLLQRIKAVKADIKTNRKPLVYVDQLLSKVQEINQFIKDLVKEQELILDNELLADIAESLKQINRSYNLLVNDCRTEEQFEVEKDYFQSLIKFIEDRVFSIRLVIENGFSSIEPRGLTVFDSIKRSWDTIDTIYQHLDNKSKTDTKYYKEHIDSIYTNETVRGIVRNEYLIISTFSDSLLDEKKYQGSNHMYSVTELKDIHEYFRYVRNVYDVIDKYRLKIIKDPPKAKTYEIVGIETPLEAINKLDKKIKELSSHKSMEKGYLTRTNLWDLHSQIEEYYVVLEPIRIFTRYEELLNQSSNSITQNDLNVLLQQMAGEHQKYIFFKDNFPKIAQSAFAINNVLSNLEITFGKILEQAITGTPTKMFLLNALKNVLALLDKCLKFVGQKKDNFDKLKIAIRGHKIFSLELTGVLLETLESIDGIIEPLQSYANKLKMVQKKLAVLDNPQPKALITLVRQIFQHPYELNNAALKLFDIGMIFKKIANELTKLDKITQHLENQAKKSKNIENTFKLLKTTIASSIQYFDPVQEQLLVKLDELNWFIDELLTTQTKEELIYAKQIIKYLAPVKKRIHSKIKKRLSQQKRSQKAPLFAEGAIETQGAAEKATATANSTVKTQTAMPANLSHHRTINTSKAGVTLKKNDPKAEKEARKKSMRKAQPINKEEMEATMLLKNKTASPYDPFSHETMLELKKSLRSLNTERGDAVLEILTQPHSFYNYLNQLEDEYSPALSPPKSSLQDDMMQSQTLKDVMMSFIALKFLPYGYYDSTGKPLTWEKEYSRFVKTDISERYIRFSSRSVETIKNVMVRFLRVVLGYDEPDSLNKNEHENVIRLLINEHILPEEDQFSLKQHVAYVM